MEQEIERNQDRKYTVFQNLIYCLRATREGCPRLLLFCAGAVLFNCLVPVLSAWLPKVIIQEITEERPLRELLTATALLTGALAASEGLRQYLDRLTYWYKFRMNTFFLRKMTKKGLTTDYRNQEDEHFRKLQSESFASCDGNFSYYAQTYDAMVLFFSNLLGFAAFTGILAKLSPWVLLFLCVTTVLSWLWNRRVVKWVEQSTEEKSDYEQKMQYVVQAADDVRAAKDVRLYRMSLWLDRIYEDNLQGLLGWYRRYTAKLFGVSAADSALALLREGFTYLVLLVMVFRQRISVAEFVLYFNITAGFSAWLGSLLGQLGHLQTLNLSMNRFRSYLEYPEHERREGGVPIPDAARPGLIELRNVSFRYEEDGPWVLKDVDLTIEPGEHLAVVGENGAGKTTLVKLICGLLEPTEGGVFYDGTDIRDFNRQDYRTLFGAVFQDHSLLPVTLAEIVAERDGTEADEARVTRCLEQAGLWEKVSALPEGIHTRFDRSFWDDGINLSGGETQKLLLARALYRDSPVILLDEPTAALDPLSENRLYESYDDLMAGRSTVFVSHRLASTRFCSRIILLERGGIAEEGDHGTLLERGGKYRELFEIQAKYYREKEGGEDDEAAAED